MSYNKEEKAFVLLADGAIFHGKATCGKGSSFGEICFNTGTTGYQEIFTDPSYFGQIMVTTNAHIGNYGTHALEKESDSIKISALVCRNFNEYFTRTSANIGLREYLEAEKVQVVSGVDTRALVTYIRQKGAMNAVVSTEWNRIEALKKELGLQPSMKGLELASKVSIGEPRIYGNPAAELRIAAIDLGIKKSIINNLIKRGAVVKLFPHDVTFEETEKWSPDGYFLSNGPGDPEPLTPAIQLTKEILKENRPLFGICLGHQVIALALGISTYKMHHGHRGINHPVYNSLTGLCEVTSQNHGFSVKIEDLKNHPEVESTHIHLNDHTLAGMRLKNKNCFSVQYHPEASPGPHDASYLFDLFINNIKKHQKITT